MTPSRPADALDPRAIEEIARAIVDDGLATRELTAALDQLVADRTNGEPLDTAIADLRAILARGGHRHDVGPPPSEDTDPS